jgi:hypothetical protein
MNFKAGLEFASLTRGLIDIEESGEWPKQYRFESSNQDATEMVALRAELFDLYYRVINEYVCIIYDD